MSENTEGAENLADSNVKVKVKKKKKQQS